MKIGVFVQNRDYFGAKIVHIPFLYSLNKSYENSEIIVLTPYKNNDFFIKTGLCKRVIYYPSNLFSLIWILNKEKFDLIFSLRHVSIIINISLIFCHARKIGFKGNKRTFFDFVYNVKRYYRRDIYRSIAFNSLLEKPLPLNSYFNLFDEDEKLKNIKKKKIFIMSGGGADFKKWSIDNYLKLCERIGKDYYYVFVLGDMEEKYKEKIKMFFLSYEGEMAYNLDFKKLVEYIKSADLVISNDCGPSHIAQLMFKPCIILYSNLHRDADRVIKEWFLPHKKSFFIKGEKIEDINVEKVFDLVKNILNFI
jgi:ADP-heptose:LPS heptosyltransferase